MKKVISLILIFVMIFTFSACGSEQNAKIMAAATEYDMEMINSHDLTLLENCQDFEVPEDISWTTSPVAKKELEDNFIYSMLIGNYTLNMAFINKGHAENALSFYSDQDFLFKMSHLYCDLCGFFAFAGCRDELISYSIEEKDGLYIINMEYGIDCPKMHEESIEAYKFAEKLYQQFKDDGKLRDEMDTMEVARVLYKELGDYANVNEEEYSFDENISENQFYYNNDTTYGFFIMKYCTCVGRAAGYQMLMHLAGEKCAGVHIDAGGGHIVNVFPYNNELYVVDAGNHCPILQLSDAYKSPNYEFMRNSFVCQDYLTDAAKERFGLEIDHKTVDVRSYGILNMNIKGKSLGNTFEVKKGETLSGELIGDEDKENIISDYDFIYQFENENREVLEESKFNFTKEGNTITLTVPEDIDEPNFFLHYFANDEDKNNPYLFTDNGPYINFIITE